MCGFIKHWQRGYTFLHSHQQRMKLPVVPCPHHHLVLSAFWILAILIDVYVVVFHCCFNLQLPNDISCGTYFHILIFHLYIFFGKV